MRAASGGHHNPRRQKAPRSAIGAVGRPVFPPPASAGWRPCFAVASAATMRALAAAASSRFHLKSFASRIGCDAHASWARSTGRKPTKRGHGTRNGRGGNSSSGNGRLCHDDGLAAGNETNVISFSDGDRRGRQENWQGSAEDRSQKAPHARTHPPSQISHSPAALEHNSAKSPRSAIRGLVLSRANRPGRRQPTAFRPGHESRQR